MDLIYAILRATLALAVVVALTRANGLRTFSKMSGFDFAITLAVGSSLASAVMASSGQQFWVALAAILALFLLQALLARGREGWEPLRQRLDNSPLLLMEDGRILEENLSRGNVTRADLMAKLREANALRFSDVRAVVLETTGDVSVLHGSGEVDAELLKEARR